MTRRNFFAKLCAVATAPFVVKAVPKVHHFKIAAIDPAFNSQLPSWVKTRPGYRFLSDPEIQELCNILVLEYWKAREAINYERAEKFKEMHEGVCAVMLRTPHHPMYPVKRSFEP